MSDLTTNATLAEFKPIEFSGFKQNGDFNDLHSYLNAVMNKYKLTQVEFYRKLYHDFAQLNVQVSYGDYYAVLHPRRGGINPLEFANPLFQNIIAECNGAVISVSDTTQSVTVHVSPPRKIINFTNEYRDIVNKGIEDNIYNLKKIP